MEAATARSPIKSPADLNSCRLSRPSRSASSARTSACASRSPVPLRRYSPKDSEELRVGGRSASARGGVR